VVRRAGIPRAAGPVAARHHRL